MPASTTHDRFLRYLIVSILGFSLLVLPVSPRLPSHDPSTWTSEHAGESIPIWQKLLETERAYRILVLNSYNKGYAWTDNEVRAIEEVFSRSVNVILRIEYMDTKMINTPDYFSLLKALYANKYKSTHFDVIIATDDDALRFLRQYREALFPGVPVVFGGINDFQPSMLDGFDNVTGVNEQADFRSNLNLILQLQPQTRRVYVIADQLTAGRLIRKEFEHSAREYRNRLEFHYLSDLSIDQIKARVGQLQEDDVVFYLTLFRDASGEWLTPGEAIPLISLSSSVPLYGQVDYMLGEGILGGRVKSSYYQGRVAAHLAQRVLLGEPASDIPIVMESPNYYMFDYRELRRFDIPLSSLPEGSIIINEPETFYYKYKKLIWSVTLVILCLITFILILLFNIRKRKRAQKGLQDIINAMSVILDQDSLEKMREMLLEIIHRVIFLEKKIDRAEFFHYSGEYRNYDQAKLMPLSQDASLPLDISMSLIQRSIEKYACIVKGRECVALFKTNSIPGNVVYLKGHRHFDDMDGDLLEILTNNVSMAMESLEKNKIQESLETARKIQQSMLPRNFTALAEPYGIDIHAQLIAAREVGGDLYDFFSIDDDHLCLAVGDVSGKGVPAALFMAMVKTLIRSGTEHNLYPDRILHKVNNELARDNEQCMFVTVFLAIYDRRSGELRYANGGHNPPCRLKAGAPPDWLPVRNGIVLGVMEDAQYELQSITLEQGEGLFVYTDGVTEAMSPSAELYGTSRLMDFLQHNDRLGAYEITDRMLDALTDFASGAGQSDDITVLVIRNVLDLASSRVEDPVDLADGFDWRPYTQPAEPATTAIAADQRDLMPQPRTATRP